MTRTVVRAIIALAAAVTLAACGGADPGPVSDNTPCAVVNVDVAKDFTDYYATYGSGFLDAFIAECRAHPDETAANARLAASQVPTSTTGPTTTVSRMGDPRPQSSPATATPKVSTS